MNKLKKYNKEFKFKVALEMIKGDLPISELISKYQVPKSVASKWKKQLLERGAQIFIEKKEQEESKLDNLLGIIGRLKVENDFLQKVSARLKT